VVDFLFIMIDFFRYLLWLRRYKRKSVELGMFRKGWVILNADFKRKGRHPPNTVGVRKLRWVSFRVVSKYLQCIVWFCDKARMWQTNGQTDGRTVIQNYDS